MEFTKDNIQKLYKKVFSYSVARYGKEPDKVSIDEDCSIEVEFRQHYGGYIDVETESFEIDVLNTDFKEVFDERKEKERLAKIERDKKLKELRDTKAKQDKIKRKKKYQELKREFEHENNN